ncbi:MAG TPA: pyridoxamine 5'-phosphate oxidase family protein [Solirubrobacteraceae bacterium]|nr:pyridoxamine 5'-phosphate oxidase family protein [Solirubrobacteraceae bacterium]
MHETADDLVALQAPLDRSDAAAGPHLRRIITPERRLSAEDLAARLTGMRLLALATVTRDGRPLVGPVDSVFFRGAFHFGTARDSIRWRHLIARPQVSATHVPGGARGHRPRPGDAGRRERRAVPPDAARRVRRSLRPRVGGVPRLRRGYARIAAERMFTFYGPELPSD